MNVTEKCFCVSHQYNSPKERYIHLKGLRNLLLEEKFRQEEILKAVKNRLEHAPEGHLRLSKSHNHVQYYCCTEEKKSGDYIQKDNIVLAKQLAQKSYDEKILRLVEKRLNRIKKLIKDYSDDELEQIYLKEHPERQKLIEPVEISWEQKLNEWKAKAYQGKDFEEGMPVILTEKGERVRSKSEKILADYFHRKGIEYKYECPIYLKSLGTVYPDFTFLSKKTGEEIYWEHNGRADDPKYARKMVRRINAYEYNGIFTGERLILTFETEQTIINTGKIEQLVKRYL